VLVGVRDSLQEQEPAEPDSSRWPLAGDVTSYFEFVERAPGRRQETWQFPRKLRMLLGGVGERHELLADQVIQGTPDAEAPLDDPGGSALLGPDLLETHSHNITRLPPG